MGQQRLTQPQGGLQVANAVLSVTENIEDPESSLISQCLQHIKHVGVHRRVHSCISHAPIYQCLLIREEGETTGGRCFKRKAFPHGLIGSHPTHPVHRFPYITSSSIDMEVTMRCYHCKKANLGGIHLGVPESVGICMRCGTGVCENCAHRDGAGRLVCAPCLDAEKSADSPAFATPHAGTGHAHAIR
jgi:hypothetical protein